MTNILSLRSTKIALLAIAFVCSSLTACGGESTGPDDAFNGSVFRFNYTGTELGSGEFSARGELDLPAEELPDTSFVMAATDSSGAMVIIALQGSLPAERFNVGILIIADGGRPTTIHVDTACIAAGTCRAAPPIAGFAMNENPEDIYACAVLTGTITLTAVTSDRVRGTLSGTDGFCTGAVTQEESDFRMLNGSFDIALQRVDVVDDMPEIVMQSAGPAWRRTGLRTHLDTLLEKVR